MLSSAGMGGAYTPGLKITARAVIRKARRLPLAGSVLVRTGERVEASQIVARSHIPGKVRTVNVAAELSIAADEVAAAMRKEVGEPVEKGELLAERKSLFGLLRSQVRAPIAGTVESISRVTGQVLLREPPLPVEIDAYVDGTVVEILPDEGAVIETEGALVQGIFGLAGETRGPLRVLEGATVSQAHAGAVVVARGQLGLDAFRRAMTAGVRAVVCGGFAYQDLRDLLGSDLGVAVTGHEALPTTLVVTEGFGDIAMARATFDLLAAHEGQTASVNGATQIRAGVIRPEIIVARSGPAIREASSPGLVVGAQVRCIRAPHFGRLGTVTALPSELRPLASEVRARVVEIALESGVRAVLPRANVELVESS